MRAVGYPLINQALAPRCSLYVAMVCCPAVCASLANCLVTLLWCPPFRTTGNPKMRDRAGKRMMVVVSYQGTPHLQVLNMRGHRMSPRTVKQLTDACDGYFDLIL